MTYTWYSSLLVISQYLSVLTPVSINCVMFSKFVTALCFGTDWYDVTWCRRYNSSSTVLRSIIDVCQVYNKHLQQQPKIYSSSWKYEKTAAVYPGSNPNQSVIQTSLLYHPWTCIAHPASQRAWLPSQRYQNWSQVIQAMHYQSAVFICLAT